MSPIDKKNYEREQEEKNRKLNINIWKFLIHIMDIL